MSTNIRAHPMSTSDQREWNQPAASELKTGWRTRLEDTDVCRTGSRRCPHPDPRVRVVGPHCREHALCRALRRPRADGDAPRAREEGPDPFAVAEAWLDLVAPVVEDHRANKRRRRYVLLDDVTPQLEQRPFQQGDVENAFAEIPVARPFSSRVSACIMGECHPVERGDQPPRPGGARLAMSVTAPALRGLSVSAPTPRRTPPAAARHPTRCGSRPPTRGTRGRRSGRWRARGHRRGWR
jgi:hypothetical protein